MMPAISPKIIFLFLVVMAVILEVMGDIMIKKWTIDKTNFLLVIGAGVYFLGSIFWIISLKYEYLARAISVFTVLNLIVIVLAGIVIFKEDLSLVNKIGIFLGILGVILIEI